MRPKQMTLSESGFLEHHKVTRRAQLLTEMDTVVPWAELVALIEPYYPKAECAGRPPVGLERIVRIHFLQHWVNLSDPALEEALREMWCPAKFGWPYETHMGPCRIETEGTDEQPDQDLHLIVNGQRPPFQDASVHDAGRRLEATIAGAARNRVAR